MNWTPLHGIAKSTTFLERQRSVVSARNVSRDFFCLRWASPLINLVCLLLSWPFYNSQSSKPNGSANPFRKRNKRLLFTFFKLLIWPMVGLCARQSLCLNFFPTNKDELAGATLIECNSIPTSTPAMSRASTPYSAIVMAGTRAYSSPYQNPSSNWVYQ